MSSLQFSPSVFEMGSREKLALGFDFSADLATTNDTIAGATVTVTDADSGAIVPSLLSGPLQINGSVVNQWFTGLQPLHSYVVDVTVTTAAGATWEATMTLRCPR